MGLWSRLARLVTGGGNDPAARAEAERVLLEADFGVAATDDILDRLGKSGGRDPAGAALEAAVVDLLGPPAAPLARTDRPPTVVVVCGVNGTGKTTTVAKLASRLEREGRSVLLAAADTFRAGAVAQLKVWADRLGVPFVGGGGGSEPAAVAFDAVQAATARGIDTVLVDTAGRLHTDERLIEELKKIVRVVAKHHPGAPHEILLVVDAGLGQNAVAQARAFAAAVPLTGLVVSKLDGTAKGGSVVALRRAVALPVRFVGTGEGIDDLEAFDAGAYARRLVQGG
jgi:fused signal recognition particle receptor